jgi:hypothetical protein
MVSNAPTGAVFIVALLTSLLGLFLYWQGWLRSRRPTSEYVLPSLPGLFSIGLVFVSQGSLKASMKKAELMNPARLQRSGYVYLVVGNGLLIAGLLQLTAVLLSQWGI